MDTVKIILYLLTAFTLYSNNLTTYELLLDFGNDAVFIHETFKTKKKCESKLQQIKKEHTYIKVYCVKRFL